MFVLHMTTEYFQKSQKGIFKENHKTSQSFFIHLNFLAMAFLVTEQFKCHSELQNMGGKETERKK